MPRLAKRIAALPFGLTHWAMSFPLAALAALTLQPAKPGGPLALLVLGLGLGLLALATLVIAALLLGTLRGLRDGSLLVADPVAVIHPVAAGHSQPLASRVTDPWGGGAIAAIPPLRAELPCRLRGYDESVPAPDRCWRESHRLDQIDHPSAAWLSCRSCRSWWRPCGQPRSLSDLGRR